MTKKKRDRICFTMNVTEKQREMMDIVKDAVYDNAVTKTHIILEIFRKEIKGYIGAPEEAKLDDDTLHKYAVEKYNIELKEREEQAKRLEELFKKDRE